MTDGDTVKVLDAAKTLHKIRLAGIDAPEKKQPFGAVSKRSLSDLVFGREVLARCSKRDRYRREICVIWRDGVDINLQQIKRGMAWHYKHYAAEQTPRDRALYAQAEGTARASQIGLWQDKAPQPPWEWRRRP